MIINGGTFQLFKNGNVVTYADDKTTHRIFINPEFKFQNSEIIISFLIEVDIMEGVVVDRYYKEILINSINKFYSVNVGKKYRKKKYELINSIYEKKGRFNFFEGRLLQIISFMLLNYELDLKIDIEHNVCIQTKEYMRRKKLEKIKELMK